MRWSDRALSLGAIALAALLLPGRPASASDWRYCYAGSDQDHHFYISPPFPAAGSMDMIETQWLAWLGRQALRYETTACPRADDRLAVEDAVNSAIRYNAGHGRSAVKLDWKPAP